MVPIPQLDRQDMREYIEKQYQLFEEASKEEQEAADATTKEAEQKWDIDIALSTYFKLKKDQINGSDKLFTESNQN